MAESVTQGAGATIGPYRLVELIGEGHEAQAAEWKTVRGTGGQ